MKQKLPLIAFVPLTYLLYAVFAFAVFQWRHPKANPMTFYTYHIEVITLATVSELQ